MSEANAELQRRNLFELIDAFASEYGWTQDQILSMTYADIEKLSKAAQKRGERNKASMPKPKKPSRRGRR